MLGKLFVGAFKLLFGSIGAGVLISIISVVVVVVRETWIK
jgi:TM2 domain-containing membrane protein YozV